MSLRSLSSFAATLGCLSLAVACSGESSSSDDPSGSTGGDGMDFPGTGGDAAGGTAAGGTVGATGGVTASGGAVASGGALATGGVTETGGAATSGGASSTGGESAAGGTSTGGAASGGTSGSGGAQSCTPGKGFPTASLLAFPGAQGFGKKATGGRGGTVYHVTNLNDSGSGSFRDAVSAANRIVVFDVGGYIQLKTAVSVKSNITIAGQSAPGQGIGFRSGEISFASQSNIIMRHVRVRPGSETASDTDDALSLYRAKNVIVDHSSFEFAPWNNIDGVSDDWQNRPVTDITFQDNIIADPTGQQFGAHTESVASNWSWYRNIFANSHNRNPLAKVNNVFVNNVLYNCSAGYTTHTSTNFKHDIINNYFIFGPASTGTDNTWYQVDKNQSIYYSGNLKDTNRNGALDGAATTPYWYQGAGTILSSPWSTESATDYSTLEAYRIAVSQAGTLPRDEMDALILSQVRTLGKGTTGTGANTVGPAGGLYTTQTQTGLGNSGYGTITGGSKPADTDKDGMPDSWEKALGSNASQDDAMQKASSGYALIEEYLNYLAVPHAETKANQGIDVDLGAISLGFSDASPTFTASAQDCHDVTISGHTAHFTPAPGFTGPTYFDYTVKGSDGAEYAGRVLVVVTP